MWLWKFFRKFSLPCSLVLGAVGYLVFANVPFLEPLGDAVGPKLVDLMPVVLFALLYVTFCKIEIKEMKPKAWHFVLQLIRTSLALAMVVLIFEFGDDYETKLVLEGAFICFICPTAAAVAVVTEKLGGSIGSLTTYTVIANVFFIFNLECKRMWLWKFFRKFSLPCSLVLGAVGYLVFANVPFLEPLGDAVGPKLVDLMPVVLFALLYVTFCKIEIKEMKPKAWHFVLQLIRTSLALAMVVLIFEFGDDYETKLVLEGAFICFICPTAAAVAVVTEKLGGSIGSLTTYTVIANVFTMVIIPSLFPMVEKGADVSFLLMSAMVFRNVTTVLVVPLILALLSRRFLPKWVDKVKSVKDLGFYMWCFNLTILMGETVRNILHAEVSGWILALLLLVPLLVCLIQFAIGKAVGRHYDASISAGQALGQKNTIVGIWLTLTFLNPLAAVAPGAYVVWQNLVNGWQLWYKEKYGRLKW